MDSFLRNQPAKGQGTTSRPDQYASGSQGLDSARSFELRFLGPLLALAVALRLPGLTRNELWFDEAATWWFGRIAATGGLMETLSLEPTPPLYYALTGGLARLFGDSELVLRFPSVLFGALSIFALYLLAAELFDQRVALLSSALLAIHPLHVFYSREARVYPLLTVLVPLALWLAIRTARTARRRSALGLGVCLVLLCYSHMYALFVLLLCLVVGLLFLPSLSARKNLWLLMGAIVGAGLLWLPYLAVTVPELSQSGAAWSVSVFYEQNPEQKSLFRSLLQLLFGANYHTDLRQLSLRQVADWIWLPAMLLQGALFVLAIVRGLSTGRERSLMALALMWPLLIVPPYLFTMLGRPMYLPGRHDVFCLVFVCCWLAVGIVELLERRRAAVQTRRRGLRAVRFLTLPALLFLAVLAVQRLVWLHVEQPASYHRATATRLAESVESGDVVVATGIRRLVTQYYLERALRDAALDPVLWLGAPLRSGDVGIASYPRSTDQHPGWADALSLIEDETALAEDSRRLVSALGQSVEGVVWTLERAYPRAEGAVSVAFLVDRHLYAALREAGYEPAVASAEQQIRHWRRPLPTTD